jgi:FecR protein
MQKLLTAWNGGHWFGELLKPAFVLLGGLALGFAFWTTTAPVAKAREMTPAEMIQSKLPPAKTLVTASKPEVLFAVCGAIREWTNDAPQIVRTAAEARKESARDIVATGIRCLGDHPDCKLAGGIVGAGLAVNPAAASNIIDLALQLASDCRGAIEIAGRVGAASDAPKNEARVTRIIQDVKLLSSKSAARPAAVNDKVREGTDVRTGDDSRSELTFVDLTITRLGANTVFSFNNAGRNVELGSGSILLRVPKNSGGARMRTDAVTVAITGTTLILEAARSGRNKLLVLEGGARLFLNKHPRESAYVRAGQMLDVPAGATKLPSPVDIDLDQIMKTSPLITDFPPLPGQGPEGPVAEGPVNVMDGPANIIPPPGFVAGGAGGFTPEEAAVTICEHGQNVQVPASRADPYLRSHPGSVRGVCQVTPDKNI